MPKRRTFKVSYLTPDQARRPGWFPPTRLPQAPKGAPAGTRWRYYVRDVAGSRGAAPPAVYLDAPNDLGAARSAADLVGQGKLGEYKDDPTEWRYVVQLIEDWGHKMPWFTEYEMRVDADGKWEFREWDDGPSAPWLPASAMPTRPVRKRRSMQRRRQPKRNPGQPYFVQVLDRLEWRKVAHSDIALADSPAEAAQDVHLRIFGVPVKAGYMFAVTPVRPPPPGRGLNWIPDGDTIMLLAVPAGPPGHPGVALVPAPLARWHQKDLRRFRSMIDPRKRRSMQRTKQPKPKKNPRATINKYLKGL